MSRQRPLGRRRPKDFDHVTKFPYSAVQPGTITIVEKILELPYWHWTHDQGYEGSCVGHGGAMERAITNGAQKSRDMRYNPLWLWDRAKEVDEWDDTNPGDDNGTSVNAAYRVLRHQGIGKVEEMRLDIQGNPYAVNPAIPHRRHGVVRNRWAVTVDEMRTAISAGNPVTIGVEWYSNFDAPQEKDDGNYWIGEGALGSIRGGHSVCVFAASDNRQAFAIKNSWGTFYPLVWMPYSTMQKLLDQDGEATLQTDR